MRHDHIENKAWRSLTLEHSALVYYKVGTRCWMIGTDACVESFFSAVNSWRVCAHLFPTQLLITARMTPVSRGSLEAHTPPSHNTSPFSLTVKRYLFSLSPPSRNFYTTHAVRSRITGSLHENEKRGEGFDHSALNPSRRQYGSIFLFIYFSIFWNSAFLFPATHCQALPQLIFADTSLGFSCTSF